MTSGHTRIFHDGSCLLPPCWTPRDATMFFMGLGLGLVVFLVVIILTGERR